jgi:hypothetical protein
LETPPYLSRLDRKLHPSSMKDQTTMKIAIASLASHRIVLPTACSVVSNFAAAELSSAIADATGVTLPIVEKTEEAAIILSLAPDKEIRYDGFRITANGKDIILSATIERGLLNGVYTLLQTWGFRRIWQKKFLTIKAKLETLEFEEGVNNPDIEFRGVCIFDVWPKNVAEIAEVLDFLAWNRFNLLMTSINRSAKRPKSNWHVEWENVEAELWPELEKRGMILNISEHSGRWFFPQSLFAEHPEWFAMKADGTRFPNGQICYGNPEAVEYLSKRYCQYAEAHPEVPILGTWPEDGYGFCQCEHCKQPGTVLKAVNQIADKLAEIRPDLMVEYLSYTKETSEVPPDVLPRKNIITLVANMSVAQEWMRKSDLAGAQGVYRLHYHITDNTAARANLPLVFKQTILDCREMLLNRLRGIIPFYIGTDTWWRSNLNIYILGRACWNSTLEAEDLIADLAEKYFPSARLEAAALFMALEKCPMVDQFVPPPWKIWQLWPTVRTDYTGEKWDTTLQEFQNLYQAIEKLVAACAGDERTLTLLKSAQKFVDFQRLTFESWHFRALAVLSFDEQNADEVRKNIIEAGKREQILRDAVTGPDAQKYGVAGAWVDYEFFMVWRLQLDKQLLEMRTPENQKPFVDMNPEVELFLPALLGN